MCQMSVQSQCDVPVQRIPVPSFIQRYWNRYRKKVYTNKSEIFYLGLETSRSQEFLVSRLSHLTFLNITFCILSSYLSHNFVSEFGTEKSRKRYLSYFWVSSVTSRHTLWVISKLRITYSLFFPSSSK